MISISRSGLEAHQDCPRKYYLTYLDGGRGWASPVDSATQLQQGTHLHLGMEALMKGVKGGVEGAELIGLQTLRETPHSLERDDYLIVEALYLAWVRTRLEEFLSEYEIVSVEEPMTVPLREIEIYVKGDVVVRSRHSGLCWSVDWKTTSSPSNWATRWKREPQGFLQTWATREKYPEVAGTIFEGLVKGKKYQGKYTSPLVRGWVGLAEDGEEIFSVEKGEGLKPFDPSTKSWPSGEGLVGWVGWLPYEVVKSSIVTSPPVMLPGDWEVWLLESEKALTRDYRDGLWPRHYGDNTCRWCPFDPLCGGDKTLEQMLEEGLLVKRPLSPREIK